ncbi:MAG: hypothetical protein ACKV2Q_04665 [Planctomycetaceae bacterium]
MQSTTRVKEEARQLVERLPETATWDDLMEEIYVRQAVERGMQDVEAGRTLTTDQLRTRLGLPS